MVKKLGQVIFKELDPPKSRKRIKLRCWMTSAPVPVAGYGGWVKVQRPKRKSITEWLGREPLSLEIDFLIDHNDDGNGKLCELEIRDLEKLAGQEAKGEDDPPLFQLQSAPEQLMPHGFARAPHAKYFIESGPAWDKESVITNPEGRRLRIGGTITVTQFSEDSRLERLKRRKRGGRSRRDFYTIKKGDTLQKIAARKDVYGDAKKWKLIAKANKIRDPKLGDKWVGKKIRIPDPPKKGDDKK